jgi:hypothetical protein
MTSGEQEALLSEIEACHHSNSTPRGFPMPGPSHCMASPLARSCPGVAGDPGIASNRMWGARARSTPSAETRRPWSSRACRTSSRRPRRRRPGAAGGAPHAGDGWISQGREPTGSGGRCGIGLLFSRASGDPTSRSRRTPPTCAISGALPTSGGAAKRSSRRSKPPAGAVTCSTCGWNAARTVRGELSVSVQLRRCNEDARAIIHGSFQKYRNMRASCSPVLAPLLCARLLS